MTLLAYIDDSKDQLGKRHLVLAGYIATPEKWKEFSEAWKSVLQIHSLEEYKYFRMPNDRPEYSATFYRTIEEFLDLSVDCYIDIQALNEVIEDLPEKIRGTKLVQSLKNPYFLATKALMACVYQNAGDLINAQPINFIFDNQTGEDEVLKNGWAYFKECLSEKSYIGAAPTFEDSKTSMPIQAADLICGHLRKAKEQGVDTLKENVFKHWEPQKEILRLAISLGKKEIEKEVNWIISPESMAQLLEYDKRSFELSTNTLLTGGVWHKSN